MPARTLLKRIRNALIAAVALASIFIVVFGLAILSKFGMHSVGSNLRLFAISFGILSTLFFILFLLVGFSKRPTNPYPDELTTNAVAEGRQPWLDRADWSSGHIKPFISPELKLYAVMSLPGCIGGGLLAFNGIPASFASGKYADLALLLLPAWGVYALIVATREALARRRFGPCHLQMLTIPGRLGRSLEGILHTRQPVTPGLVLKVKLYCVRRVVDSKQKYDPVREEILWQEEKTATDFPSVAAGGTGLPVSFQLPANLPECFTGISQAESLRFWAAKKYISWRLEAGAKMSGQDFRVVFDVPVFHAANSTDKLSAGTAISATTVL